MRIEDEFKSIEENFNYNTTIDVLSEIENKLINLKNNYINQFKESNNDKHLYNFALLYGYDVICIKKGMEILKNGSKITK